MFSKIQKFRFHFFLIFQIVVFGTSSFISQAQQLTYDVQYFSNEEGLSDHRVLAILEHSNGYTWVGTYNGLNRFDGYDFVPIDLPARKESTNGTLDTYIHRLFELETGDIAIIYGDGGIQVNNIAIIYDLKTGKSEEVILTNFDELTGTLHLEKRAPLKFLTIKREWTVSKNIVYDHLKNFFKIENQDGKQSAFLTLKTGEILDLSEVWNSLINPRVFGNDFSKIIYFSSLNGLVKLDMHRSPFKTYLNEQLKDWGYNLSGRAISDIGNGKILFSTEQKDLALLDKITGQINYISLPKTRSSLKKELLTSELYFLRMIASSG